MSRTRAVVVCASLFLLLLPVPTGMAQVAGTLVDLNQVLDRVAVHPRAAAAWTAFAQTAEDAWKVRWDAGTGAARLLWGGPVPGKGITAEESARRFLAEAAGVFLLRADLADLPEGSVRETAGRSRVVFPQRFTGLEVDGAEVLVLLDSRGRVRAAASTYRPFLDPPNRFTLDAARARDIAARFLQNHVRAAEAPAGGLPAPVVHPGVPEGRFAWRWQGTTRGPAGNWKVVVDAETGSVLEVEDLLKRDGALRATGRVFPSMRHALLGRPGNMGLRFLQEHRRGSLGGKFADVVDAGNRPVFEPGLRFLYDPLLSADAFDQVQGYYAVTAAGDWFRRRFGLGALGIPVVVNDLAFGCDAALDPSCPEVGGNPCLRFGDASPAGDGTDLIRDWDVVLHEYGHAAVAVAGFPGGGHFGDALHEAAADYFAGTYHRDPCIAEYAWPRCQNAPCLRNLDNRQHFPEDVQPADPHLTGLIWGGLLWDVRKALGSTKGDRLAWWSTTSLEAKADFVDAIFALLESDVDLHRGRNLNRLIGLGASRGLSGPEFEHTYLGWWFLARGSVQTHGEVFRPGYSVHFAFIADPGRLMGLTVSATSRSPLQPDFVLRDGFGSPIPLPVSRAPRRASVSRFPLPQVVKDVYLLEITGLAGTSGGFRLQLSIR